MSHHHEVYSYAHYYDIAFDFRDVPSECEFLNQVCRLYGRGTCTSFLELAAGPAWHATEFARRGLRSAALDLSPGMVDYGREKAEASLVQLEYVQSDMTDFGRFKDFDLAALLMDSSSYLLSNEAVLSHFACVAASLAPSGIYVMEMSHPRDVFSVGKSCSSAWTSKRGDISVDVRWGDDSDAFDPITQISQTSVRVAFTDGSTSGVIEEVAPQRCFTANEIHALVNASGHFEVAATYGAMSSKIPFSNDREAWRMVLVLRKR